MIPHKDDEDHARFVCAEDGDDFQQYCDKKGKRIKTGEVVGVELKKGNVWKFYLIEGIRYDNNPAPNPLTI